MIKNWIQRSKRDFNFEKDNKQYFIKHYFRVLVLMALVFTAAYHISANDVCSSLNGTVIKTDSFYKLSCSFEYNENYIINNTKYEYRDYNIYNVK